MASARARNRPAIYLVEVHQVGAAHLRGLIQGLEVDVRWWESLITERPGHGVQVMRTYRDERALSRKVLMQLVL